MSRTLLVSDGRPLPFAYRWLVEQGLTRFGPWHFIEEQAESDGFRAEFAREVAAPHPSSVRDFQPFARHAACDDFAGFIIRDGRVANEVLCVHLTFAGRTELPGYPGMTRNEDVWAWLSGCVVEEMRLVADRLAEYHARQPQQ
jgi:hypothetical protein